MRDDKSVFPSLQEEKNNDAKPKVKIPLHEIQYTVLDWMMGKPTILWDAPKFPNCFRTYYQDDSKKTLGLVKIEPNGLAIPATDQHVYEVLSHLMKTFRGSQRQYCLTHEQMEQITKAYIKEAGPHRLKEPPAVFCWESDKSKPSFNRIKDPAELSHFYGTPEFSKLAPIFCSIVDRCDEKLAFRQFLGSLLFPDSSHKQTLHITGSPNAGKTTTIEILLECFFGQAGIALFHPHDSLKDPFAKEELVNKMAIFADEIYDGYYTKKDYKMLTGATMHRVRGLFKAAYSAKITAKMIATSNEMPSLPSDRAVLERIVIVKLGDLAPEQRMRREEFKQKLLAEIPYILADILEAFRLLDGKSIQTSGESHAEALELGSAEMQVFFDQYFVAKPGIKTLKVSEFKRIVVQNCRDLNIDFRKFREFVIHQYGCRFDYVLNGSKHVTNIGSIRS